MIGRLGLRNISKLISKKFLMRIAQYIACSAAGFALVRTPLGGLGVLRRLSALE